MLKRATAGVMAVGLLLGGATAWADTFLEFITPKNIKDSTFTLKTKAAPKHSVEFLIQRDVSKVDEPGKSAFLSYLAEDERGLGTPVKLKEEGKFLTYRFTVPEDQVADAVFTLWGGGIRGEGITFRFKLAEFWKPGKD